MEEGIKKIENDLNKLCSQHDQLMSLLDIADYVPNCKQLYNINQNISTKISSFEKQIDQDLPSLKAFKQRERVELIGKQHQFQTTLEEVQKELSQLKAKTVKTKQEIENKKLGSQLALIEKNEREKMKEIEENEEVKLSQIIARQKIELKIKKQHKISSFLTSNVKQTAMENIYDQLKHQIELETLGLPLPPIDKFAFFTAKRLKNEINKLTQSQMIKKQQKLSSKVAESKLQEKIKRIEYQIKGLKRFCSEQLMISYCRETNKKKVQQTQFFIINLITQLEKDLISFIRSGKECAPVDQKL